MSGETMYAPLTSDEMKARTIALIRAGALDTPALLEALDIVIRRLTRERDEAVRAERATFDRLTETEAARVAAETRAGMWEQRCGQRRRERDEARADTQVSAWLREHAYTVYASPRPWDPSHPRVVNVDGRAPVVRNTWAEAIDAARGEG